MKGGARNLIFLPMIVLLKYVHSCFSFNQIEEVY